MQHRNHRTVALIDFQHPPGFLRGIHVPGGCIPIVCCKRVSRFVIDLVEIRCGECHADVMQPIALPEAASQLLSPCSACRVGLTRAVPRHMYD